MVHMQCIAMHGNVNVYVCTFVRESLVHVNVLALCRTDALG